MLNSARNSMHPFILGARNGDPLSVLCKPPVSLPVEAQLDCRSNSGASPPEVIVRSGAMNDHNNMGWNKQDSTVRFLQSCSHELFLRGVSRWLDILPREIGHTSVDEPRPAVLVTMWAPPKEPDPPPKRMQWRVKQSDANIRLRMNSGAWLKANPAGGRYSREYLFANHSDAVGYFESTCII